MVKRKKSTKKPSHPPVPAVPAVPPAPAVPSAALENLVSDQPRYLASLAVSLKGIESVLKTRAEAEQQARMAQPSTMGEKYMSGRWLRRDGNIYTAAYIEPAVEAYKARVRRQFPRRK